MITTLYRGSLRRLAVLAVLAAGSGLIAEPALAVGWRDQGGERHGWHGRGWRGHEWRERMWRRHEWRERHPPMVMVAPPAMYAPPPAMYAPPPAVVYAPPPVAYMPPPMPSATIVLPLNFR